MLPLQCAIRKCGPRNSLETHGHPGHGQECTDAGLQALAGGCSTLTSLSLYWNVKYTDVGISAVARANPRLQNLSVSGCKFLTDAGAIAITENCTALTTLDLTRCVMTTDKALISAAVNCRNLQTLLLYASASPGDQGVQTVLRNLTNLQVLDLCGAKDLTDEGFEPLLSGQPGQMPSLRRLNLGWCCNLGDKCLTGVGRGCPALLYLYVLGNKKMTMEGLRCISTGCTRLCGLDICGLCDIQDRSLPAISPMFPSLTLLAKLGVAPNYDDV